MKKRERLRLKNIGKTIKSKVKVGAFGFFVACVIYAATIKRSFGHVQKNNETAA